MTAAFPLSPEELSRLGFFQFGVVPTSEIPFHPDVRMYCEKNTCRKYGTSWACPPGVGSFEECRARCLSYAHMLVLTQKYDLEDSFDYEGMVAGHADFAEVCDRLADALAGRLPDFLLLSNEGCPRCETCTYPDAPCRFPENLHPSVEAYGILVSSLAQRAGINYINGKDTVTYFGAVLYGEREDTGALPQTPLKG